MGRTSDSAFFPCPICGNKPYVHTYEMCCGDAVCKGGLFSRHKRVWVSVGYAQPSKLFKELSHKWNQLGFRQTRFIFDDADTVRRMTEPSKELNEISTI